MPDKPLISILIVTWQRKEALKRCIDSVLTQTYDNLEIIVVDNGSSDGTAILITQNYPSVKLIQLQSNIGCPSARNVGFTHCIGDYIYQLDDDGWLATDAIERAVLRAKSDDSIGIVMSAVYDVDPANGIAQPRDNHMVSGYRASFSGGCSMVRKKALALAGTYPDDYFRQGEEEPLALRLLQSGFVCFLEAQSIMYHAPNPIGRVPKMITRYNYRNIIRTTLRLWPMPWCYLRTTWLLLRSFLHSIKTFDLSLFLFVTSDALCEITRLHHTRASISLQTLSTYRRLQRNSVGTYRALHKPRLH